MGREVTEEEKCCVRKMYVAIYCNVRTDGWWIIEKKVLDFAQKIFRSTSGDINMRKFGKSAKNFYRKKIQLQLSKSGGFFIKFPMSNWRFFSLKILSDEAQVI